MITGSKVTKKYGDVLVVDDVTFELPKGKLTAIIGPNGAGKSTLLSIISRLLKADAGTVEVAGLDVSRAPSEELAKQIAVLRQDNHIAARLTVHDLVTFGRYPHSKGRYTTQDKVYVDRAIEFMGLTDHSTRFLDELSGGQRQRAFVAMVLAQDTPYVLLDEPLNNLDMKHAVGMMTTMRKATREMGKTVATVLHDINFASCYADHIVIMRNGAIAYQGTPGEVITPKILKEIYEIDVEVHRIAGQIISVYFDSNH